MGGGEVKIGMENGLKDDQMFHRLKIVKGSSGLDTFLESKVMI